MSSETTTNLPSTAPQVHNGTYTVEHPERGHFTIELKTARSGQLAGKRILSILQGPNNETDYRSVAFWDDEAKIAIVWKRFRGADSNGRIDGYTWNTKGWTRNEQKLAIWTDLVTRGDSGFWHGDGYRVLCEGRCVRCNRKLTHPESIKTGIGPECAGRS